MKRKKPKQPLRGSRLRNACFGKNVNTHIPKTSLRGSRSRNTCFGNASNFPYKEIPTAVKKELSEILKKNRASRALILSGFYPRATLDFLKDSSINLSKSEGGCYFILMPNKKGVFVPHMEMSRAPVEITLMRRLKSGKFNFLEDKADSRYGVASSADLRVYEYFGSMDNEPCKIYTKHPISELSEEYDFEGVLFPVYAPKRAVRGSIFSKENVVISTIQRPVHPDFSRVEKEIVPQVKKIRDLSLTWNYDNDTPICTDDELYIIMSNLLFSMSGTCALDLILCGPGGCKKTAWLDILAKIFGEKVTSATGATRKGLVPSFHSDDNKQGALLSSKFVTLIDDYFRQFSQLRANTNAGLKTTIMEGLEQIMTLLDRKQQTIYSGKRDMDVMYKSSFFATDNFSHPEVLKEIWRDDKAILRRYSFLMLSEETVKRGTSVLEREPSEIEELSQERLKGVFGHLTNKGKVIADKRLVFAGYKDLFRFLRAKQSDVEFDENELKSIIEKHSGQDMYLQSKAKALMISVTLLNTLFRCNRMPKGKIIPIKEDYELVDKLLGRIVSDFKKVVM